MTDKIKNITWGSFGDKSIGEAFSDETITELYEKYSLFYIKLCRKELGYDENDKTRDKELLKYIRETK